MTNISAIQANSIPSLSNSDLIAAKDSNSKIEVNGVKYKISHNLDAQVSGNLNKLYSKFSKLLQHLHIHDITKGKEINATLAGLEARLNKISQESDTKATAAKPAGFPLALQSLPEKGTAEIEYYDSEEGGYQYLEIDINNKSSLTSQLLQHFAPKDDGIFGSFDDDEDGKGNLFDITKITIPDSDGVDRSVYFPEKKPGDYKHFQELFDGVPVDIKDMDNIVTPDNFDQSLEGDYGFDYAVHNNLHVIQQGTTNACGPTSLAMILMDKNVDISKLQRSVMDTESGMFMNKLNELANDYTKTDFQENSKNILKTLKENLNADGPNRAAIVMYGPHFIVVDSVDDNKISIRDPFQGTLSEIALASLDKSNLGSDIIFFPKD
ncbi:cysteine peptidase family C39 domain-containing protein [Spartinivicinus ruber]|uniref:cysteine peptidase family C39 domain-containing protein n=1 Tax=Spartinivicinus ruber TaxID=2683272 RepID=UPI0013D597A9|nr:cysteine peptidase family C39 domain-containing protein [Spartinivicinus ruber]